MPMKILKLCLTVMLGSMMSEMTLAGMQAGDFRKIPYVANGSSLPGAHVGLWDEIGLNTESESLLGASRWLYWNETGLGYTISLPGEALGNGGKDGLTIHLCIDTRSEYEDVLYEYREGAGRVDFIIKNHSEGPKARLKNTRGLKAGNRLSCDASLDGGSLVLRGTIPWENFPSFRCAPDKTVAFSIRLALGRRIQAGCPDLDQDVSPMNNPELLEPFQLARAGEAMSRRQHRLVAEECIENGRNVLYMHWCEPAGLRAPPEGATDAERCLRIKIPELSVDKTVMLAPSVANKFFWWTERILLNLEKNAPNVLTVAFAREGVTETIKVPLKMLDLIRETDARLESIAMRLNRQESENLLELFRDCMIEEVRRLQTLPDGIRPVRRRHRESANHEDVEVALDELLALASKNGRDGDVSAYCSIRPDGVRSPFKVYYPASHDPKKKYPVVFQLKGYNRYSTRSHFMLQRSMKFFVPDKRDFFIISPYGAGNNDEWSGFDELNHLIKWARQNLNISEEQMTIRGHSRGGTMAFYLGTRMPGLFTSIDVLSADPMHRLPGSQLRQTVSSVYAPNLGQTEVCLTIGSEDTETLLRSNRRMHDLLKNLKADVTLKIIPGVGHQLGNLKTDPVMGAPIRWVDGRPVYYTTTQPIFHEAYGIKILEYAEARAPSGFDIVRRDECWNIQTKNIQSLEFDEQWHGKTIMLDGRQITAGEPAGVFRKNEQGEWAVTSMDRIVCKSSLRPGGMEDILRRSFIIVYGSQDPRITPFLIERAHDIAHQTSGTKFRQWSGRVITIMSDEEYLASDNAERDVLLIGSPQQNKATARLGRQSLRGLESILRAIDKTPESSLLFQAILPKETSNKFYYFVEAGSSPLAYTGAFIKEPAYDYSVSENRENWASRTRGNFDTNWTLDEVPRF